jgi:ABC-type phosphate/phosphonate transport system substrate-binding protein
MHRKHLGSFILYALLVVVAAACRRQTAPLQSTALPTLTPTPRSTPLPALPTSIPAGTTENPLRMVLRPDGALDTVRSGVGDVEEAIRETSGLVVKIEVVERYAEALSALCDSSASNAAVVWVNGPAYMATRAQNCGTPALQVARGSGDDRQTGEAGIIISTKGQNLTAIGTLKGRTFCRLGNDDFYSWLAPALVMQANRLNPVNDLKSVKDYDTIPALVKAVAAGDCDGAGIPQSALADFADEIGSARDRINTISTSIPFPYAILMFPIEVPLGVRLTLTDTLIELAEDSTSAVKLRVLLGQSALIRAQPDDFGELVAFMQSTGLDFAQSGS